MESLEELYKDAGKLIPADVYEANYFGAVEIAKIEQEVSLLRDYCNTMPHSQVVKLTRRQQEVDDEW